MSRGAIALPLAAFITAGAALAAEPLAVTDGGPPAPLAARLHGPAVLHLWATWCAPCRDELPELADFLAAQPGLAAGIVVVSVDTAPVARVAAFLADLGVDLPPLEFSAGNAGAAYGVTGYPATVFLAADGSATAVHVGPLDWSAPATAAAIAAHLGR